MHKVRTRMPPIPDRSLPRSTRTTTSVNVLGHLSKSGIQNSDSTVEQPGQRTVKLLEEQPQKKKKLTITENKDHDVLLQGRSITAWFQETNAQHLAIKTSRLYNLRTETYRTK